MYINLQYTEAVVQRCSVKKVFLELLQNSQENTCVRVSFLIKLKVLGLQLYQKGTLAQLFFCKFCEISKSNFFIEHLWWMPLSVVNNSRTTLRIQLIEGKNI